MLTVDFINVGYGDAILIREKKDGVSVFTALIDCGDVNVDNQYPSARIHPADFLANEGISHLDLLAVTHLHLDHVGGIELTADVVKISEHFGNYIPDRIFWGKVFSVPEAASEGAARIIQSANIYSRFLCKMSYKDTAIRTIQEQCSFSLENARFFVSAAEPSLYFRQQEILDRLFSGEIHLQELDELHHFINDTSLCIRVEYAGRSFELTSDISAKKSRDFSQCTVVKIPHHGHSDSMTPELAEALKAQYAVISVSSDRQDNCPDAKIIKMLMDTGTKVLITDHPNGKPTIRFTINENGSLFCSEYK